jgi:hypothetical protein
MNSLFDFDKNTEVTCVTSKLFEVRQQQFTNGFLEKTLQYEMKVALLGTSNSTDFGYEIDRQNLLIDNVEPNTVFEQLAYECGQIIFPLRFSIDKSGTIKQLYEYTKLIKRWNDIKERLLTYYEGDMAVNYILRMDHNLNHIETTKELLRNQLFIFFYFSPLPTYPLLKKDSLIWKTAPFMDFVGEIKMVTTTHAEENEPIHLQSDSPFITINATYTFDEYKKSIDSCNASIVQDNELEIKLSFIAKQIEVLSN